MVPFIYGLAGFLLGCTFMAIYLGGPRPDPEAVRREVFSLLATSRELSGRVLQRSLKTAGLGLNGAEFYAAMDDMRRAGLVDGYWMPTEVDGRPCNEMRFRVATRATIGHPRPDVAEGVADGGEEDHDRHPEG